jgi:hypothetical protein
MHAQRGSWLLAASGLWIALVSASNLLDVGPDSWAAQLAWLIAAGLLSAGVAAVLFKILGG